MLRLTSQVQHLEPEGHLLSQLLLLVWLAGAWGIWPTWRSLWEEVGEGAWEGLVWVLLGVEGVSLGVMGALWGGGLPIQLLREWA